MSVRDPVFRALQGSTKTITTVANSSVGANWTGDVNNSSLAEVLEVYNSTASIVYVRTGIGAQTAVVTDYPVPPTSTRRIGLHTPDDNVAVFLATGGTVGSVFCTRGLGGTSP